MHVTIPGIQLSLVDDTTHQNWQVPLMHLNLSQFSASSSSFPKQEIDHLAVKLSDVVLKSYNKMKGVWDVSVEPCSVNFTQHVRCISNEEYEEGA